MIIYYDQQKIGTYHGMPSVDFCAAIAKKNDDDSIDSSLITMTPETQEETIALVRAGIEKNAGDNASLLGTTADGVQLLLFAFSQLTVGLHQANSLAEVREAAAPFNELATSFLAKVASGEVKLPFQAKGLNSVVEDIEVRATAVTDVLTNSG